MSKPKYISLELKVGSLLIIIALILAISFFLLIAPKIKQQQQKFIDSKIQQMINLTTQQAHMASKALINHIKNDYLMARKNIETTLKFLDYEILLNREINLNKIEKQINCKVSFLKEKLPLNQWFDTKTKIIVKDFFLYKNISYAIKTAENKLLVATCFKDSFKAKHMQFEEDIKNNIQKSFALTSDIHKGKIFLLNINKQWALKNERIDRLSSGKSDVFWISNMSNVKIPTTSNLRAKEILFATKPLKHILENKKAKTWVSLINEDKEDAFLLVVTAFEEDINRSALNSFFQVLFYAFISLLIAIILGYFLFRRVLKNINILSNTAKEVNKGNLSLRSKVKGEDDIGILGETFDSMLENIEKNFKTLDLEVEKRTKELIISLEEKEMLLKEIHHRVKNNLALTIGFIKLQQSKIKDESTKKVLSDIQERVFTMELLHRKLYESSNLNKIPMKEYISSLTFDIAKAYNISKDCIKLKLDEVDLNIQYAMPCGLILNELITNSFKYAYKKEFLLFISFKKLKNSYELIVLDNGEGFSKHIDIYKANSLGLKLITSIAKAQLKAKLTYDYEAGSKFTIVFSIH
ncbi:hypothetical protein CP985_04450 [Malaciobacter mytili LMG 24559]|uniref:histidine kinase n=1 Tax=Malaciobacter mytili LMG 24559 TaxID=1032238 RepID=A0AAX2AJA3_9BACT|nr:histidine kinase dimerization/phosphoacceptor domain -containing protein [Malaciobacter mytili]AXH14684.1 two-component system sensor histidine kinase [Malaciobacter mytili LMG 24559]RXK16236.1 hypothetical protein CP985_04450 [Malaciobacter mytili LMG 24559]